MPARALGDGARAHCVALYMRLHPHGPGGAVWAGDKARFSSACREVPASCRVRAGLLPRAVA